jgi:hypothetical protein
MPPILWAGIWLRRTDETEFLYRMQKINIWRIMRVKLAMQEVVTEKNHGY